MRYYMQGFRQTGAREYVDADGNTYDLTRWDARDGYREATARTPDGLHETYLIAGADGRGLYDRDGYGNLTPVPGAERYRAPRSEHGVLGALRASLDSAPGWDGD